MSGGRIATLAAQGGYDFSAQITRVAPLGHLNMDVPEGRRTLWVAHWFLVLVYLLGWSVTLVWWQRRKAHLLQLHAAPEP